ncbi:Mur ligase family protein [Verrucomicrobium sp. BvORR106]|uniref:UDP-N-acetylmuramate--L-alanine ligase n=1 Tax=Verrucomicrobium sp. BvORR106 TaxID=1403819 RepID=UPI000570E17F|nr:Mur ligase family protein [Verrucomicrobium sp. BvORR106]
MPCSAPGFRPKSTPGPFPPHVHFIGICGRAMGAVAMELARLGVRVTGSDRHVFPPMGGLLAQAGIAYHTEFSAGNLTPTPDHVVIGSYFSPSNREVASVLERRLPWSTLAGFVERHFLQTTQNLVVAGTNGKTTTTAMLAWILKAARKNPSYLVAGEAPNLGKMFHSSQRRSGPFVLEGDEYLSGLGDLNPKFLHYRPSRVLVTNLHWDHVEVFPAERAYRAGFEALVDLLPPSGGLVLNADDPGAFALATRRQLAGTETIGFGRQAQHRITGWRQGRELQTFHFLGETFQLAAFGKIYAINAALAITLARQEGVPPKTAADALRQWQPVRGRQELLIDSPQLTVVKEEAYHPHALAGAVEAVRARFPKRRLVLLFQPRYTGGAAGPHQAALPESLAGVDLALVTDPLEIAPVARPFSSRALCSALRRSGIKAHHVARVPDLVRKLQKLRQHGDVAMVSLAYRNEAFFDQIQEITKN